jgi:serine O-acetyltransferase
MSRPNREAEPAFVATHDPIWSQLREEAREVTWREPELASFLFSAVLNHDRLEDSIAHRVAQRIGTEEVTADLIRQTFDAIIAADPELPQIFRADLAAIYDRDPACTRLVEPLLYFKGFHALQTHRFAHHLYEKGRTDFALYLQSQSSRVFGIDIHPAAKIGRGIMFDHGSGIVIGETAEIGDNTSILHAVTLGGSGKENGDRHPKIGCGVMIGAGAKILGNIRVGDCARIASGSVVLKEVPPRTTVAGVPAKVVGEAGCTQPSRSMNQLLGLIEETHSLSGRDTFGG